MTCTSRSVSSELQNPKPSKRIITMIRLLTLTLSFTSLEQLNNSLPHSLLSLTHRLGCYHVADSFVERVHLMWLQITDNGANVVQYLLNEGHHFLWLDLTREKRLVNTISDRERASSNLYKMSAALLCNLDESVTRHILNTIVCFCKIDAFRLTVNHTHLPCMNSNSLLTTVFRNFQCALSV